MRSPALLALSVCVQFGCSEAPAEVACPGGILIEAQPTNVTLLVGDSARVQGEVIVGCGERHYDLLWPVSDSAVVQVMPLPRGAAVIRGRSAGEAAVYVRWQQHPSASTNIQTVITEER